MRVPALLVMVLIPTLGGCAAPASDSGTGSPQAGPPATLALTDTAPVPVDPSPDEPMPTDPAADPGTADPGTGAESTEAAAVVPMESMTDVAEKFFAALVAGEGYDEYLLTDGEIRAIYTRAFGDILVGTRGTGNAVTARTFRQALSGGDVQLIGIDATETLHIGPGARKRNPIFTRAVEQIAKVTVRYRIGTESRVLVLTNCFGTDRGWRFLKYEVKNR